MSTIDTDKWYVIKTMSRAEKKTAERLYSMGFTTYLPLQTTIKQWSDRKKWVHFPLFRSYVFARIHLKENIFVLQSIGVY